MLQEAPRSASKRLCETSHDEPWSSPFKRTRERSPDELWSSSNGADELELQSDATVPDGGGAHPADM